MSAVARPVPADIEPIAIVGAGPVGMSAALALARYGLPSIALEARPALTGEGSRSICTQGDVLAIFERLGCAAPMLEKGVWWTLARTYFRDAELFQTHLPASRGEHALPPFINLGQQDVERTLLEAVERHELIDLRWSHAVVALDQDPDGVGLQVDRPPGSVELRAPYVLACDGPRSLTRKLLGVQLPGHSFSDRFLIADIRADLPFPNERRFFFDPPFNPGRQVLIHQQPEGVWRIDWQVPPDTDVEEERRSGRLDERIRAVIGPVDYELVWLSSYRFHQRVAERFRVGRVFLAGDAGHLMAPFGARGLNSGVADADNLSWKLWLVLNGVAPDALLDSYHDERHEAARENVGIVGATMRFMVPPTRWGWWGRNLILRGSLHVRPLRRLVNSGRLYQPHTYRRSAIVRRDEPYPARAAARLRGLPEPGALAPDAPAAVTGDPDVRRLRHLVGDGFLALVFPPDLPTAEAVAATVRPDRPADVPLSVAIVAPPGRWRPAPHMPKEALLVSDRDGSLRRTYAPDRDRLYLIRPDGHIAARGPSDDARRLGEWLATATGGGRSPSAT